MDDALARRLLRAAKSLQAAPLTRATAVVERVLREALPQRGLQLRRPAEPPLAAGARFEAGSFTGEAGTRPYRLYVPARRQQRAPLLIMLHGCTQTAEDFAAGTRMNALAEAHGMLVLYPQQVAAANTQRCWNWFQPGEQQAGAGEPAIIAGMTWQVAAAHGADTRRVFAAGLSAGGAEAAILGATYPELFAAVGVHSGLACGAAHDLGSAWTAMRRGAAGRGRIGVPTIVFHGDADSTVNVANARAVAAQVDQSEPARVEQGQVAGGFGWTRTSHGSRLEEWVVHGLGHAWSGGDKAGSYTDARGPDASEAMVRFFLQRGT